MIKYRRELNQLLPKEPVIAEIGVAEGFFSADMLAWGGKVYLIDMWETNMSFEGDAQNDQYWHNMNYEAAMNRVKRFGENAIVLRGPSNRMTQYVKDGELDMAYLDACHSYRCVLEDLQNWLPKVKKGGIVAGHDYLNPVYGVNKAVNDFVAGKGYQVITLPEDKDEDGGFYFYV